MSKVWNSGDALFNLCRMTLFGQNTLSYQDNDHLVSGLHAEGSYGKNVLDR